MLTGELLPFPGVSELSYNASLYYENRQVQRSHRLQLA